MDDFIFGTLATDELRLAHVREQRAGITHTCARSPRDPMPGQPVTLDLTIGPTCSHDRAWVHWTTDVHDLSIARPNITPMEPIGVEWDTLLWGYVRRWRATLPGQPADTVVRYCIAAGSESQRTFADDGTIYAYYVADDPPPAWARDAIVYHIFVDRFYPGDGKAWQHPTDPNGFFGGTLRGVTDKLEYIANLGANCIWLSPIFPSPSYHGYDATDYFDIEPRLGTKDDLRVLLDAAHARGMRVLLDFVPNHWSHLHPTFQAALKNPHSPYRHWYTFRRYPDEYAMFFTAKNLPQVNLRHPAARQYMLDAAKYWLAFGVDGYRLDYAAGPTPDFWADFRRVTRAARPDCWTFGETVEPPDVQLTFEGLLDGNLDFILLEAFRQTFAFGRWEARRFVAFLERHQKYFPASFARPSFLDNHDMNRFLWVARRDPTTEWAQAKQRLKIAALCQFTLAGQPIIYYGTEVALKQSNDVQREGHTFHYEARTPMGWGDAQDSEMFDFYRHLIALRQREPALRYGSWRALFADADSFAYIREHASQELVVAINLSSEGRAISLPAKGPIQFTTTWNCTTRAQADGVVLELPGLSGAVMGIREKK